MRWSMILTALVALGLLVGCAGQSVAPQNGKQYTKNINLGYEKYPLPPGTWNFVDIGYSHSHNWRHYALLRHNKDIVTGVLILVVDTPSCRYEGYKTCNMCERENIHHTKIYTNKRQGKQNCWALNHLIFTKIDRTTTCIRDIISYIRSKNLTMPKIMFRELHRFARRNDSDILNYNYLQNPEENGFKVEHNLAWSSCSWHPLQIAEYPKKKAYVDKLINEGEKFHTKLKKEFF